MIYTIEEAVNRLSEVFPRLAYDHFSEPQKLPFACYTFSMNNDGADDRKDIIWVDMDVEVYSDPRCIELEIKTLEILNDTEVETESVYIDDEKMYMTRFSFRFPYRP